AEDRERFQALIDKLGLMLAENGTAMSLDEAVAVADKIGYPVMVRPSYVLGGRAMAAVYDRDELIEYFREQVPERPEHPILIDKFLQHATEVDVDVLSDGSDVYVAGIMEHIEEAGIHSGDSACVIPPYSLSYDHVAQIAVQAEALARELHVVGLMNIQFALRGDDLYIIEVNPRASRTVPFVSKATGVPLAYLATQVMLGKTLEELDPWSMKKGGFTCVKEAVMPFNRFPGVDIILGPEMHSTGEVMGMGATFPEAFLKSQLGAGTRLPEQGSVFLSVNDRDKEDIPEIGRLFHELGFELTATRGTAKTLEAAGLPVRVVNKVQEGRPNIVDLLINHEIALVVNTASGSGTANAGKAIRRTTLVYGIPCCTTIQGARASAKAIGAAKGRKVRVESLQEYYKREGN
ncbi:MAG: ATP-grasp domain-containing protein, partial [Desulfovibrio sp.]|nr:ATP-grasp domain-containing protein [Desulfovibrio sp.]